MKVFVIILVALVVVGGGIAIWGVGVSNSEIQLVNVHKAQDQVIGEFYGKMFAILKQKAGVVEKYKESFGEIYKDLIAGRYSGDGEGLMMKWIQESNPQFDAGLFQDVMNSIEGQREGFFIEQKKMTDIVLQHDNLRMLFPSKLIVGDRDPLAYEPILPVDAKKVLETREETSEDLEIF
jgi:hypothetical protein